MSRIVLLVLGLMMVRAEEEAREGGKCERIRLPMCQDLGYNWTAMPNLMGHKDQKEAEEAMSSFRSLLSSGCSSQARFLVCSAFAPLCAEEVSGAVSACRAVCELVRTDCRAQLAALPPGAALDCGAFPLRPDRRLCMRPPDAAEPEPEAAPARWGGEGERGCGAGLVRAGAGHCVPACGADVRYTREQKRAAEAWGATLAWAALLATTLALLTFCAEPGRYRYPERPAVWMAACHGAVALAYVARACLGARAVSCAGDALAVDGLASPACVAFFAVTYYFTLAADAWFANAGVAWYLTAAGEWSTEGLERAAAYLHAAAWGWAGAWTACALALRRVGADELTGACGVVGALEGVPRGAALLAGGALGAGAARGVARVRAALGAGGARRAARTAARAGAAAALYLVVAGGALGARAAGAAGAAQALALCSGVAAAAWACSRKSCAVWRRALCPPRKPTPQPQLHPPLLHHHHIQYKRPLHVSRV